MPYDTGAIRGSNKFSKEAEGRGDRKKAGRKHSLVVSLKRNGQGRVSSFRIGYSGSFQWVPGHSSSLIVWCLVPHD